MSVSHTLFTFCLLIYSSWAPSFSLSLLHRQPLRQSLFPLRPICSPAQRYSRPVLYSPRFPAIWQALCGGSKLVHLDVLCAWMCPRSYLYLFGFPRASPIGVVGRLWDVTRGFIVVVDCCGHVDPPGGPQRACYPLLLLVLVAPESYSWSSRFLLVVLDTVTVSLEHLEESVCRESV